jgi:hypothetical protein
MYELDHGSQFDVVRAPVAGCACSEEHQRRAQSLAAPGYDVFRDLADQCYIRPESAPDHFVHRTDVGGDEVS